MTTKVAKTKRNNQKRNKLVKQGVIKKKKTKFTKHAKQQLPKVVAPAKEVETEESDDGEDLLQMVEAEDLDFIKTAIANRSYNIYNKVRYTGVAPPKARKRKLQEDESVEQNYEVNIGAEDKLKFKPLLPIKTSKGIIPQQTVDNTETNEDIQEQNDTYDENNDEDEEDESRDNEDEYVFQESSFDPNLPISEAQLLAKRNEAIRQQKIAIGSLSAQVLENPEEKISNLRTLLSMMDETSSDVYLTVKKLILMSLLEIFKDLLPSYEIKNAINDGIKLKKDTLKLHKYEENLLLYYKKYLQKLEKYCFIIRRKRGDSRRRSEEENKLGELAVKALCDLLISHPYFNYAKNIAQAIVPFMNHSNKNIREIVKNAVKTVFKEDKKEEITLQILRIINHYLKNHAHNVNTEMLEVLLALNLRDINLDQEKESDIKQKKLKAQKHKLLQMSKKERKRKKKLQLVEKEMLETKAEENKQQKQLRLTEITKIVFNIYFRILKNSSNTKVLGVCLEGLAKFAHCINLEFYMDLVNVLDKLLKEDWIGYKEQLHCIQTVFSVLGGVGEALTLDPTRFYTALYKDLLTTTASRNHENTIVLLKTLTDALIRRKKKITNKRAMGYVKRLATLSLQLLHNGSLGCLGLIRNIMQLNRNIDILLDFDNSVGDGKFQVDLDDPEYANASETALYELLILTKHYHPVVSKYARHIASGVPTTGEGSLPAIYGKCTPEELFSDFSMSEMAFNPAVPPPKKVEPKVKTKRMRFADNMFETECKTIVKNQIKLSKLCID